MLLSRSLEDLDNQGLTLRTAYRKGGHNSRTEVFIIEDPSVLRLKHLRRFG